MGACYKQNNEKCVHMRERAKFRNRKGERNDRSFVVKVSELGIPDRNRRRRFQVGSENCTLLSDNRALCLDMEILRKRVIFLRKDAIDILASR